MKVPKMLSLDSTVFKDIKERTLECSFNFSEWAENEYKKQFLDVEAINKEIALHKKHIKMLEKSKKEIAERQEAYSIGLSRSEERYIQSVPNKISQGMNELQLLNVFNRSFHRKYNLDEFKKIVREIKVNRHGK